MESDQSASRRLSIIKNHLNKNIEVQSAKLTENDGAIPKLRQSLLKWNGWGYNDSKFELIEHEDEPQFKFTGDRYDISSHPLSYFMKWAQDSLSIDPKVQISSVPFPNDDFLPKSNIQSEFLQLLRNDSIDFSIDGKDRLVRSHGHTFSEVYTLLHCSDYRSKRIPDIVVWPKCHEEVVKIVNLCKENNVTIIPIGGGTSVTNALEVPLAENRSVLSLDLTQMNRILWLDSVNLLVCAEAGITGKKLEQELKLDGYCCGHEPDSQEFSTLGGWVATRASGMKKNIYGNIEDLLVHVKMVTTEGIIEKDCMVPRISCGPDIHQFILGSEGIFGVVTQVIIKIRPKPKVTKCGSIIFPNFTYGVKFLREVARQRLKPASIRLMDNDQFRFGMSLKPGSESIYEMIRDKLKKFYVTNLKGFDEHEMCVVTILYEGEANEVINLEKNIHGISTTFYGLSAGEENGRRGYTLTFVIAYLRDCGLKFGVAAESFETSVPWERVLDLCKNVKSKVRKECERHGIKQEPLISCRVTQSYDSGACVYFYLAFNYNGVEDPVETFESIEREARNEILANGGSISHHHGVGKLRKEWVEQTISSTGLTALKAVKKEVDPKNIFAGDNLI